MFRSQFLSCLRIASSASLCLPEHRRESSQWCPIVPAYARGPSCHWTVNLDLALDLDYATPDTGFRSSDGGSVPGSLAGASSCRVLPYPWEGGCVDEVGPYQSDEPVTRNEVGSPRFWLGRHRDVVENGLGPRLENHPRRSCPLLRKSVSSVGDYGTSGLCCHAEESLTGAGRSAHHSRSVGRATLPGPATGPFGLLGANGAGNVASRG